MGKFSKGHARSAITHKRRQQALCVAVDRGSEIGRINIPAGISCRGLAFQSALACVKILQCSSGFCSLCPGPICTVQKEDVLSIRTDAALTAELIKLKVPPT